jgi:hypothetical protein
MTTYLRRTKPHSTGLAISAAELGIATELQPTRNRGQGHRDGARPTPTCIRGKQHWYTDCFILNTRHPARSKTNQPAVEAIRKVEEARKDSKMDAQIKTALETWAARQPQSTRTLRVDDGKPLVHTDTFVISTGLFLPSLDGHDGHTGHDDNGAIAIDARTEPIKLLQQWLLMTPLRPTYSTDRWSILDPTRTSSIQRHKKVGRGRATIQNVILSTLAIALFSSQLGARWNSLLVHHMVN